MSGAMFKTLREATDRALGRTDLHNALRELGDLREQSRAMLAQMQANHDALVARTARVLAMIAGGSRP